MAQQMEKQGDPEGPERTCWSIGVCVRVNSHRLIRTQNFVPSFAVGGGGIFIPKIQKGGGEKHDNGEA